MEAITIVNESSFSPAYAIGGGGAAENPILAFLSQFQAQPQAQQPAGQLILSSELAPAQPQAAAGQQTIAPAWVPPVPARAAAPAAPAPAAPAPTAAPRATAVSPVTPANRAPNPASSPARSASNAPAAPAPRAAAARPGAGATTSTRPASENSRTSAPTQRVTVRSGDTLSAIARRNGTTWQKLYAANRATVGSNPDTIKVGAKLKLPGRSTGTTKAPAATGPARSAPAAPAAPSPTGSGRGFFTAKPRATAAPANPPPAPAAAAPRPAPSADRPRPAPRPARSAARPRPAPAAPAIEPVPVQPRAPAPAAIKPKPASPGQQRQMRSQLATVERDLQAGNALILTLYQKIKDGQDPDLTNRIYTQIDATRAENERLGAAREQLHARLQGISIS